MTTHSNMIFQNVSSSGPVTIHGIAGGTYTVPTGGQVLVSNGVISPNWITLQLPNNFTKPYLFCEDY